MRLFKYLFWKAIFWSCGLRDCSLGLHLWQTRFGVIRSLDGMPLGPNGKVFRHCMGCGKTEQVIK